MNEWIDEPLGMPVAAIGQPPRRHEDLRLLTDKDRSESPTPLDRRWIAAAQGCLLESAALIRHPG